MTTEEKAKAYDEALERARKIHDEIVNNEVIGFPGQITDIFPEFRESEDEKRMRAIAVLEQQLHFWNYEGPIDKIPPATKRKDLIEAIDVALSYLEKQKEQKPWKVGANAYFTPEQKPAEWSEEDDKMLQRIIRHTESEYQDWCNDKYGNSEIVSDGKRSCLERLDWLENRLKSLRPQSHWKPSEEQMDALKRYSPVHHPDVHLVSLYDDLKKLM